MGELMSSSRGGKTHMDRILSNYMLPIGMRVLALLQEGVDSGEFRPVDPAQFVPTAIGSIVHYFLTAPAAAAIPQAHAACRSRRSKTAAPPCSTSSPPPCSADREAGIKLAARISAAPPSQQPLKPALSRTKGKRK